MRSKLFIILAMFMAFSSATFAADTVTVTASTDLQETRDITVAGNAVIDVKRSAGATEEYIAAAPTLVTVDHDLFVDQQIQVAATLTGTPANWADRNLVITAEDLAADATWTASSIGVASQALITAGMADPAIVLVSDIPATAAATGDLTVTFGATAGLNAVIGIATADITFTLLDM